MKFQTKETENRLTDNNHNKYVTITKGNIIIFVSISLPQILEKKKTNKKQNITTASIM